MTELGRRVLSALVLGPAVLLLVLWGNPGFALLVAAGAAIVVWEWNGITRRGVGDAAMISAAAAAGLAALAAAAGLWLAAALLLAAGAAVAQAVARRVDGDRLLGLGVLYAGLPAIALVALRSDAEWGLMVVLWLLLVVWATDIGAFFVGRAVGGPKLWPAVSPKKTWSGALGGTAAAVAVGLIVAYFALPAATTHWTLAAVAVFLSAAAQLGDLAESALKRRFNVKDSSNLIPGHGGIMDRVDGVLGAAVAGALLGVLRGGVDSAGGGLLLW